MASDAEWRGLHPASLLVNLVPHLWRSARGAWFFIVAIAVGSGLQSWMNLLVVLGFLATAAVRSGVHFLTLRYRVNDGKLELRGGLLTQSFRAIDIARIQNVEVVQNIFHRMSGLVEVRVDTAGEVGAEGLLSAISVEEGERLRVALSRHSAGPAQSGAEAVADAVAEIGIIEILGYGVSAGRIGAAAAVLGVVMNASADFQMISTGSMPDATAGMGKASIAGLVLLALAGGYVFSVGGAVLRFYGYRLTRTANGLATESGLLTRRRVEIPVRKVQMLRVEEPLVRRWMGYATMNIETAASGVPSDSEGQLAEGIVPMVHAEETMEIARLALPTLDVDPWTVPLRPAAARALWRGLFGASIRWSIIATVVALVVGSPWAYALLAWGWLVAALDWRWQGWLVTDAFIVCRRGFVRRDTVILPRDKIQSLRIVAGPVLRAIGLARVVLWVPGGRVGLPDMTASEADGVFRALTAR